MQQRWWQCYITFTFGLDSTTAPGVVSEVRRWEFLNSPPQKGNLAKNTWEQDLKVHGLEWKPKVLVLNHLRDKNRDIVTELRLRKCDKEILLDHRFYQQGHGSSYICLSTKVAKFLLFSRVNFSYLGKWWCDMSQKA